MDLGQRVDLEKEMKEDKILIGLLADRDIAVEFYSALCNMRWRKIACMSDADLIMDKLKGTESDLWSSTWRNSGGMIADIRNDHYNTVEDYMDFYCKGNEGHVSDRVKECFKRMGWEPAPWGDDHLI